MTSPFELDLESVKVNQKSNYVHHKSCSHAPNDIKNSITNSFIITVLLIQVSLVCVLTVIFHFSVIFFISGILFSGTCIYCMFCIVLALPLWRINFVIKITVQRTRPIVPLRPQKLSAKHASK